MDKAVALKPRDAGIYLAAAQFYWRRRRDASACMALHKQASETPRLLWDTSVTVRHFGYCKPPVLQRRFAGPVCAGLRPVWGRSATRCSCMALHRQAMRAPR